MFCMEGTLFLYHFDFIICCSSCSDIEISKQQMPKKIAEVAKEATILDYEVTVELNMALNLQVLYYFKHINL